MPAKVPQRGPGMRILLTTPLLLIRSRKGAQGLGQTSELCLDAALWQAVILGMLIAHELVVKVGSVWPAWVIFRWNMG